MSGTCYQTIESVIYAPCPKCGSENGHAVCSRRHLSSITINVSYTDYGIRCGDCGFEASGYLTKNQAIKAWNRRAKNETKQ